MDDLANAHPATFAAQAGGFRDSETGGVAPPIQLSSTFARGDNYEFDAPFQYAREGAPTERLAENILARLDGGADARVFSSGLAAIAALLESLPEGAHIVAPSVMYFGVKEQMQMAAKARGFRIDLFDPADADALAAAILPGETRLVWIEPLANPTWAVTDIAAAAKAAHAAGARLAVDSTATPPCTTRPIEFGADIVMHSTTKYLNGHSDLIGGALIAKEKDAHWTNICKIRDLTGAVTGGFNAWLLIRGIRTLYVRFARQSANALALAQRLERAPGVRQVLYPGLEHHPGHAIASAQMTNGYGGLLSLLIDGAAEEARRVAAACRLFAPATSFGGVESLIEHRKTVEGPDSPTPDNLLRLAVGIEDVDDLAIDLEQALSAGALSAGG